MNFLNHISVFFLLFFFAGVDQFSVFILIFITHSMTEIECSKILEIFIFLSTRLEHFDDMTVSCTNHGWEFSSTPTQSTEATYNQYDEWRIDGLTE